MKHITGLGVFLTTLGIFLAVLVGLQDGTLQTLNEPSLQGDAYVTNPSGDTFVLGGDMEDSQSDYKDLVDTLMGANSASRVTIILRRNNGGLIDNEYYVRSAMLATHATTYTDVDGWASSAAISILFSGDYVKIHKHIHVGIAHLSSPRTAESIAYDIKYSEFYRIYMTPKEWQEMVDGEDVLLQGSTVCKTAHSYVVQETNDYCVVHQKRMDTY